MSTTRLGKVETYKELYIYNQKER